MSTPATESQMIAALTASIELQKAKADALRSYAFGLLQDEVERLRAENLSLRRTVVELRSEVVSVISSHCCEAAS